MPCRVRAGRGGGSRGPSVPGEPVDKDGELAGGDCGQPGPCGSGWVMRALKTMMSVALTGQDELADDGKGG